MIITNAYEVFLEMSQLSFELEQLMDKKAKAKTVDEAEILDKRINHTELEFIRLKHLLQDVKVEV